MKSILKKSMMAVLLIAGLTAGSQALAQPSQNLDGKTIVLVHGAFADGESWNKVIPLLEAKGLHVVAVQNPLSSLNDDVAATRRAIDQQKGSVILVGHSWGGVVITQAGNDDKVKGLVYVAAIAPDSGQSIADVTKGWPAEPWTQTVIKDSAHFMTLPTQTIIHDFAQDLPEADARVVAATQGPWFDGCPGAKVTTAAWHTKPAWFVVSENDRMIDPKLQETMAKTLNATVTKVNASHVVMLSHPDAVAATIIAAASQVD